jgi:hypothetical protein
MLLQVWDPVWRIKCSYWNLNTSLWTSPEELPTDPPGGFQNWTGGAALSPDEMTLYHSADYSRGNILRTKKTTNGWPLPTERIPELDGIGWSNISFNGSFFYGVNSNYDILSSMYNEAHDQFSMPVLVDSINTEWTESTPWISYDNTLILFSSNRPGGYGSYDLYSATWDQGSQKWINITNLGPNVNTSLHEQSPCIAENAGVLYFSRIDNSDIQHLMQAEIVTEPDPIQEILDFIEKSVADGTLVPVKPGPAGKGQLGALINMIETAGNLIDSNDPNLLSDICGQLHAALGKTDGQSPPPDFVTGPAAPQLAAMIEELMNSLGCE